MNRVAIIYPYFRTRSFNEMLFAPLGAASLASQLNLVGIETGIIDCTFMTLEQVRKTLLEMQPQIVGIYSMVTLSRNAFNIADMVRNNLPSSLIVAGGPLPTLYPDQYAAKFDIVFRGECDLSFPRFCRDFLEQNISRERLTELSLDSYEGIFVRSSGLNVDSPLSHYSEEVIQSFPVPARRGFDHQAYHDAWLKKDGSKTTSIITTFGCPFDCDFCSKPVFGNSFRRRNMDAVFREIAEIKTLGYDTLWIADDNFTLDHSYLEEFCQRILGTAIQWNCLSRTNGINPEMALLMKNAGCTRVYLGLESGCLATLKLMNKHIDLEEAIRAVNVFHEAGINVGAFFIVGYPGETIASVEETIKFSLSLPLDQISFNIPFPLPGSRLFDRVNDIDQEMDWVTENETIFVYKSEFDQAWIKKRIDQTLNTFLKRVK
jgi:anaerobic magnesium-protoporphyrin IX monomethyl ester cyclase